jgi:hypothetical protein
VCGGDIGPGRLDEAILHRPLWLMNGRTGDVARLAKTHQVEPTLTREDQRYVVTSEHEITVTRREHSAKTFSLN